VVNSKDSRLSKKIDVELKKVDLKLIVRSKDSERVYLPVKPTKF